MNKIKKIILLAMPFISMAASGNHIVGYESAFPDYGEDVDGRH